MEEASNKLGSFGSKENLDAVEQKPKSIYFIPEMWYQMFLWALLSSVVVHIIAAAIAFAILRRHRIGK